MVLFISVCAYSQNNMVDAVHLKNGSIIKGVIIEQIPGKQVTIKTADGSTFVCLMEEISKITKEEESTKPIFKSSNKNYNIKGRRLIVDLGYVAGSFKGPILSASYGSQINKYLFVGGGVGLNYMTDFTALGIPVFADVRGYALNGPIQPFIALRIGYKFNTEKLVSYSSIGGFYCNPFVGIRFITNKKQAINLGIGYSIERVNSDDEYDYDDIKAEAFTFKIGYEF